jgi:hypothetical protein
VQYINFWQSPIFRATPKTDPTQVFSVRQTLGRYIMQIITERNKKIPKNINHAKGDSKNAKL